MFSLYRTLSLRYLEQRWPRAVLVVASIALGVATLVATRALNQSMTEAVRGATAPLAGVADLHVSNGESGVPISLATELSQIEGVRRVEPVVVGRVRMPDLENQRQALLLGIMWRADSAENNPWGVRIDWTIPPESVPGLKGADPQNLLTKWKQYIRGMPESYQVRPVLVGGDLASELKPAELDQRLQRILDGLVSVVQRLVGAELAEVIRSVPLRAQPANQEPHLLIKAGTIHAEGFAADLIRNVLIMDAYDAAELLGQPGMATRIDLFLEPGIARQAVTQRVEARLANQFHEQEAAAFAGLVQPHLAAKIGSLAVASRKPTAKVRTPEANDQRVQDVMAGLQIGFSLCGFGAIVVGLFLVYNALAVTVAERRHEIGILRSVGASRGQIWKLFLGEAGLLGLAGAVLGVPAGVVLAHMGLEPMKGVLSDLFIALQSTQVVITPETIVFASLAGILTALIAAMVPAIRAAQEQPADAIRRNPQTVRWEYRLAQLTLSLGLVGLGLVFIFLRARLQVRTGSFGGLVLVLLGLLFLTPLLAAGISRVLQPVIRITLGLEARLAADNLVRSPGRTGLVITALAAGVAMVLQTAGIIRSNEEAILKWVDESIAADLFITSGSPVSGSGQNMPLKEDFGNQIEAAFPAVKSALPVRFHQTEFRDKLVFIVALDSQGFYQADKDRGTVPGIELYPRLRQPNNILISENFAALYGARVGDAITLPESREPTPFRVIGTVVDYSWNRGTIIMDRDLYKRCFHDPLVDAFDVYIQPGKDPDTVREAVLRSRLWGVEHSLVILKRDELRQRIADMIRRIFGIAYSQEIVVGLVAALGVVMALLISVLQRRRELGLLRAVGATRGQILRTVLAEAMLMGFIGTLIGLAVGVPIEWYCVQVIMFEEAGFLFPVLIPWLEAGLIAGIALLVATLAGFGPAWHTSRLRIPEAIAYE
ncbi:MAG TPA: FtsX-like permease family protein [Gemmataceae bacterium]|jgi:putative ABC transport system permease protein|nr:FtsX-like permease family protein [Gemmataceae bacterium]